MKRTKTPIKKKQTAHTIEIAAVALLFAAGSAFLVSPPLPHADASIAATRALLVPSVVRMGAEATVVSEPILAAEDSRSIVPLSDTVISAASSATAPLLAKGNIVSLSFEEEAEATTFSALPLVPEKIASCVSCPTLGIAGRHGGGAEFDRTKGQSIGVTGITLGTTRQLTAEVWFTLRSYQSADPYNNSNILTKELDSGVFQSCTAPWTIMGLSVVNDGSDRMYANANTSDPSTLLNPVNRRKLKFDLTVNGKLHTVVSQDEVPLNRWVHAVAVWSGTEMRLYMNTEKTKTNFGFQGSRELEEGKISDVVSQLTIGSRLTCGSPLLQAFDGVIDNVSLYDREMFEPEIQDRFLERT